MADAILDWNAVALEANRVNHTNGQDTTQNGPPRSARALAIVHLAMYDAYVGVDTAAGLSPYLPNLPPAPTGASARAAAGGAAYTSLSSLFPSQQAYFDAKLQELGNTADSGHGFGVTVAQALLQDRAGDPDASPTGYTPSDGRCHYRADPDNPPPSNDPLRAFHAPFYGARSKGFAVTARHELDAPPCSGDEYLRALREVRGLGIAPELMGTLPNSIARRTAQQTLIGIYWAVDGRPRLGTPPRMYNDIIRKVAMSKPNPETGRPNNEAQNARLFAMVNAAMADAGILAWDQKYIHDLWRPVTGVREHDTSMGPGSAQAGHDISEDADPTWLPLGAPASNPASTAFAAARLDLTPQATEVYPFSNVLPGIVKNFTPPFPAYPSGHATFGAAAFHVTRLFYDGKLVGDRSPDRLFDGLDFVSYEFDGVTVDNRGTVRPRHVRNFPGGLWEMILENSRSRVFLGVHWIFDGFAVDAKGNPDLGRRIGGVPLGLTIAEDIFRSGLNKSTVGPRKE